MCVPPSQSPAHGRQGIVNVGSWSWVWAQASRSSVRQHAGSHLFQAPCRGSSKVQLLIKVNSTGKENSPAKGKRARQNLSQNLDRDRHAGPRVVAPTSSYLRPEWQMVNHRLRCYGSLRRLCSLCVWVLRLRGMRRLCRGGDRPLQLRNHASETLQSRVDLGQLLGNLLLPGSQARRSVVQSMDRVT